MKIKGLLKRSSRQSKGYLVLASGTAVSFVGKSIGRGLTMAGQVVLARWLGPELFGVYAIAWTLLRVLGLVTPLGLDLAVIRFGTIFVHEAPARFKGVVRNAWMWAMGAGLVCAGLLFVLAPAIARFYGEPVLVPVLRWFAPAFLFWAGMRIAVSGTMVTKQMGYAVLVEELIWPGLNLLFLIALVGLGYGVVGTAVAVVISLAVAFVVGTIFMLRMFPVLRVREFTAVANVHEMIAFSLPAILAFATGVYLYWVDRLMIGYWLPVEDVGIYQAVGQFSFIFATILASLNAVMMPIIAEHLEQSETKALERFFRVATKWGLYLSLPFFLAICLEPALLIEVVFGEAYVAGTAVMLILITTQLINVSTGAVNHLLILGGQQRLWFKLSLTALAVNIGLNLVLLPVWGMEGAAWATAVSITGLFGTGLWFTRRKLGLWPYDRRYLKGVVAAVGTWVGLLIWQAVSPLAPIPYLLLTFLLSGGLFLGILWGLGFDEEEKALFSFLPFSN